MARHAYCSSGSLFRIPSMSSCQLQVSVVVLFWDLYHSDERKDELVWIWWAKLTVTVILVSNESRIDAVRTNNIEHKFVIRLCFEVMTLNVHNVNCPFYFDMMISAKNPFPAIVRHLAFGTEGDIVSVFLVRPDNWKLCFEICAAEFRKYESILA